MTKSIRHCFRLPLPEFRLARSSMKGGENRIPYIDNSLLLIILIEHDVILWVFFKHSMTCSLSWANNSGNNLFRIVAEKPYL